MKIRILKEGSDKGKIVDATIEHDKIFAQAYIEQCLYSTSFANFTNCIPEFEIIEEKSEREQIIEEMKKVQSEHFETRDCINDSISIAMFNGMEVLIATISKKEPELIVDSAYEKIDKKDNKEESKFSIEYESNMWIVDFLKRHVKTIEFK